MKAEVNIGYKIDNLLSRFNFTKVQKAMEAVGWKWFNETPNVDQIREKAKELLSSLDPTSDDSIETLGLRAEVSRGNKIRLSFVLESKSENIPAPTISDE